MVHRKTIFTLLKLYLLKISKLLHEHLEHLRLRGNKIILAQVIQLSRIFGIHQVLKIWSNTNSLHLMGDGELKRGIMN